MDSEKERRIHKRLQLKISVLCQTVGICGGNAFTGKTVDVSPGGILVEFNSRGLSDGQLLSIEMSVPPTEGLLEYGGRFSSYAKVIRVSDHDPARMSRRSSVAQTIALEFCESPKLQV